MSGHVVTGVQSMPAIGFGVLVVGWVSLPHALNPTHHLGALGMVMQPTTCTPNLIAGAPCKLDAKCPSGKAAMQATSA